MGTYFTKFWVYYFYFTILYSIYNLVKFTVIYFFFFFCINWKVDTYFTQFLLLFYLFDYVVLIIYNNKKMINTYLLMIYY